MLHCNIVCGKRVKLSFSSFLVFLLYFFMEYVIMMVIMYFCMHIKNLSSVCGGWKHFLSFICIVRIVIANFNGSLFREFNFFVHNIGPGVSLNILYFLLEISVFISLLKNEYLWVFIFSFWTILNFTREKYEFYMIHVLL